MMPAASQSPMGFIAGTIQECRQTAGITRNAQRMYAQCTDTQLYAVRSVHRHTVICCTLSAQTHIYAVRIVLKAPVICCTHSA